MGLIDHDTLHRVMAADDAAAFVEPSADLPGRLAFATATDDRVERADRPGRAGGGTRGRGAAQGVLAAHRGRDVETAFGLMRQHARTVRHRVHDVAHEIVRGTIPEALTISDGATTPRDRGDDVRSRNRGHPGQAGVENRQGRP